MSDPPLSDIDFKNKIASVRTTLNKKFLEVSYSNTRGTVMSRHVFGFDEPDLPTKIKVHNCLAMTHS